jgi:small subunit ribosomal protein S9
MAKAKIPTKYFEAVGRRKTAIARVRIWPGKSRAFLVNDRPLSEYFPGKLLPPIAGQGLGAVGLSDNFEIKARVSGGGKMAQAQAVRLGVSRALVKFDAELYKTLRQMGFLTRDPRMRERKKPGLKRARKAPQWQKR